MTNKTLEKFISLAAAMPEGMCINEMEAALRAYKETKSKEAKVKLAMACQLFCTKMAIDEEGLVKVLRDTDSLHAINNKIMNAVNN